MLIVKLSLFLQILELMLYFQCSRSFNDSNIDFSSRLMIVPTTAGLGLNNQLIEMSHKINDACEMNYSFISFESMKDDYRKDNYVSVDVFLDIDETNQNLTCISIVPYSFIHRFINKTIAVAITRRHAPEKDYVKYFVLAKNITWTSFGLPLPLKYYGLHFRMEADWMMLIMLGYTMYTKWLSYVHEGNHHMARSMIEKAIESPENSRIILSLLEDYKNASMTYFNDRHLPIVIATGLGHKDSINKHFEWLLDDIVTYVRSRGFTVISGNGHSDRREINAAAEMKVMLNASVFIGDKTSSFGRNVELIRTFRGLVSYLVVNSFQYTP